MTKTAFSPEYIERLRSENARLTAEVERLTALLAPKKAPVAPIQNTLGVAVGDSLTYEPVGTRSRGTFRKALRDYGFDKREIDAVVADLDAGRDTVINYRGTIFNLRVL